MCEAHLFFFFLKASSEAKHYGEAVLDRIARCDKMGLLTYKNSQLFQINLRVGILIYLSIISFPHIKVDPSHTRTSFTTEMEDE